MKLVLKLITLLTFGLCFLTACGVPTPEENQLTEDSHDLDGWHSLFERRDVHDMSGTSRRYSIEFDDGIQPKTLQREDEQLEWQVLEYSGIENMLYSICAGYRNDQGEVIPGTAGNKILVDATAINDLTGLPQNFVFDASVGKPNTCKADAYADLGVEIRNGKLISGGIVLDAQGKFSIGDATIGDYQQGQVLLYRTPANKLLAVVQRSGTLFDQKTSFYGVDIIYRKQDFPQGIVMQKSVYGDYNFDSFDANLQPTNSGYGLFYTADKKLRRLQITNRLKIQRDVTSYQGVTDKFYLACTITDLAVGKGYGSWQDNQVFLVRGTEQKLAGWTDSSSANYQAVSSCNASLAAAVAAPELRKQGAQLNINIAGVELAVDTNGSFAGGAIENGQVRLFKTKIGDDWLLLYSYQTAGKNHSGLLTKATKPIVAQDNINDYSWSGMDKQGNTAMYSIIQRTEGLVNYIGPVPKWLKKQGDSELQTVSRHLAMAGDASYLLCLTDTRYNDSPVSRQQFANDTLLLLDTKRLKKINPNSEDVGRTALALSGYNYCDLKPYKNDENPSGLVFSLGRGKATMAWHRDAPESGAEIAEDGSFNANGLVGTAEFYMSHSGLLLTRYQFSFTKDGNTQTGNGIASTHGGTSGSPDASYSAWLSPDDRVYPHHWYHHLELNAAAQPQWLRAGYPWHPKRANDYPKQPIINYQGIKNLAYVICSDSKLQDDAGNDKIIKDRLYVNTEAVNALHELGSTNFSLEHGFTSCNANTPAAVKRISYKKAVGAKEEEVVAVLADDTEIMLGATTTRISIDQPEEAVTYKFRYEASNGMWFEFYRTPANQWLVVYSKDINVNKEDIVRGILTAVPPEQWISG